MKIIAVSNDWSSNKDVHLTLKALLNYAKRDGHEVDLIDSAQSLRGLGARMRDFQPDRIHICISGSSPITWLATYHAKKLGGFTSSMDDPELSWMERFLHKDSSAVYWTELSEINPTQNDLPMKHLNATIYQSLYQNTQADPMLSSIGGPRFVYIGSCERSQELLMFLNLKLPGNKVVLGTHGDPAWLNDGYPKVYYVEASSEQHKARVLKACDVLVCPNRPGSPLGLTHMNALRAAACNVATAGYEGANAYIVESLGRTHKTNLYIAAMEALWMKRPIEFPECYSQKDVFEQFMSK